MGQKHIGMKGMNIHDIRARCLSVFILIVVCGNTYSQANYNVYTTLVGDIYVSGTWDDTPFRAMSNECIVQLDYETGQFIVKLDISTLRSGNDQLDTTFTKSEFHNLQYEGKLGINVIRTTSHEKEAFEVEGFLNCAPHYDRISGSGTTEYIYGDVFSCLLNISYAIDLSQVFSEQELGLFGHEVNVEILQAVLKRSND